MPDASPEIVLTAQARPRSWVREHLIDPHTPEAHERKIMERYQWVQDHLPPAAKEALVKLRPAAQKAARLAGVSQTVGELTVLAVATAGAFLIAGRALREFRQRRRQTGPAARSREAKRPTTGSVTAPWLAEYNAALREISRGRNIKELLLLDPIGDQAEWRNQRGLRERMFRFLFIEHTRGFIQAEREMDQFFRVLDTIVTWAHDHQDDVRERLLRVAAADERVKGSLWESLVGWIHTQAVGQGEYLSGGLSDPEIFPLYLYELELHLGRFGKIPQRIF